MSFQIQQLKGKTGAKSKTWEIWKKKEITKGTNKNIRGIRKK